MPAALGWGGSGGWNCYVCEVPVTQNVISRGLMIIATPQTLGFWVRHSICQNCRSVVFSLQQSVSPQAPLPPHLSCTPIDVKRIMA